MKAIFKNLFIALLSVLVFACTDDVIDNGNDNVGNNDGTGKNEEVLTTFTASLTPCSKVSIVNEDNVGKLTWSGDEYLLVSNGSADVEVDASGAISGEGAEWVNASEGTLSSDRKSLTFSTSLPSGSQWYIVAVEDKNNISSLSSEGLLATNAITSSDGESVRYIGYAKASVTEDSDTGITFSNVMSYLCFSLTEEYHAVTFEANAGNTSDFCQSVFYSSDCTATAGTASSDIYTVKTSSASGTNYFVPVTPVGKWTSGVTIKFWDEQGYEAMSSSSPLKTLTMESFESKVNTVTNLGNLDEVQQEEAAFSYEIPEKVNPIDPSLFSSLGVGSRWFSITSNVSWTASVNESETTASGVVLKTTSGKGSLDKFEVTVGQNTDFDNRKTIVIDFLPEGLEPVKVVLEQEAASIMTLEFCNQDGTEAFWPFEEEANISEGAGTGTYTVCGYSFGYSAANSNYSEAAKASWTFGKSGSYIATPAIEGRKFVKAKIFDINGTAEVSIQDEKGNDVSTKGTKTLEKNAITTWNLENTCNNTSYRYVVVNDKTLRIRALTLEYAVATADDVPPAVTFEATIPSKTSNVNPDTFNSLGKGSRWFSIASNVPWTAAVNESLTTAAGVVLSTTSGEGNLDKFEVTVGQNTDMDNEKQIVIDFTPEGGEVVQVTLTQEKGAMMRLEFCNQDGSEAYWPFDETANTSEGAGTGAYTVCGYSFGYSAVNSNLSDATRACWQFGKSGSYILSPIVEGRKLVQVKVIESNGGAKIEIKNEAGDATVGDEKSTTADEMKTWNLENTEIGESYRVEITNNKTLRIKTLIFTYE